MTSRPIPSTRAVVPPQGDRPAFTLIEVLVVITIISILTALVTVASLRFLGTAREAATRSTIKKVDEAILERVSAVNRYHQRPITRLQRDWEKRGWLQRWYAYGLDLFAASGDRDDARLVLSRKGMLLELLPVNQAELMQAYWFWSGFNKNGVTDFVNINNVPVPYLSAAEQADMAAFLADVDGDSTNNVPAPQALDLPGEVFYFALVNAPVLGGQRVDEEEFRPSELIDTDGDGLMELGDAWGNPIHFYRWPTRLVNDGEFAAGSDWSDNEGRRVLIPNAPTADLYADPDDRAGYFAAYAPAKAGFETYFHDVNTWHAPLVMSPGPDGLLGVRPPGEADPTTANPRRRGDIAEIPNDSGDPAVRQRAMEELYDNVTNHNADGGL